MRQRFAKVISQLLQRKWIAEEEAIPWKCMYAKGAPGANIGKPLSSIHAQEIRRPMQKIRSQHDILKDRI
jgi:hypothetical protein